MPRFIGAQNASRLLLLDVVARRLFTERTRERRREEFGLATKLPPVWLAIDEAHQFVPKGRSSLCKEMLIRWVKEGRQPGLSLIVATQQPAAIAPELLSQCDVIFAHKITAWEDIYALDRLSATYMDGDLKNYIRNLNRRGEALLVDDETESMTTIRVRPRFSSHGGAEIQEKTSRKSLF
ncbi:ATP-binding protein [Candidatus Poribacteria bacterium]|nr:ATP-binding protein [Candidatus Poribacteria bacterium]